MKKALSLLFILFFCLALAKQARSAFPLWLDSPSRSNPHDPKNPFHYTPTLAGTATPAYTKTLTPPPTPTVTPTASPSVLVAGTDTISPTQSATPSITLSFTASLSSTPSASPTTVSFVGIGCASLGCNIQSVVGSGTYNSLTQDGGTATSISLDQPTGVCVDAAGNIYIGETYRGMIRKVSGGVISTVAGIEYDWGPSGDGGQASAARVGQPRVLRFDSSGNLYFADSLGDVVRRISSLGVITRIAGQNSAPGFIGNGVAGTSAKLNSPAGLALDSSGNLYISDSGNHAIRKIVLSTGIITTLAGNGSAGSGGDGGPASAAQFNSPQGLLVVGNQLYVADSGNNRVRIIDLGSGTISAWAGTGTSGYSGDGGAASAAELNSPWAIASDACGSLYISDAGNFAIRKVNGGIIATLAGNGSAGLGGDGSPASGATLNTARDLFVSPAGDLYFADQNNGKIREISGCNPVLTSTPTSAFSPTDTPTMSPTRTVTPMVSPTSTITIVATATPAKYGYLGADVNDLAVFTAPAADYNLNPGCSSNHNLGYDVCKPLANNLQDSQAVYWANQVEQYQAAGLDFVAPWLKSDFVNGTSGPYEPANYANLVQAISDRGMTGKLFILPFDDNPSSWCASWNNDNGHGFGYAVPFDLSNHANWKYVWDYNLKVFWQNVPDAYRMKVNGQPAFAIWSLSPAFVSNAQGNASQLITYIKAQALATFGFTPYFIAPQEWMVNDTTSQAAGIVDAVYPWFVPTGNGNGGPHSYSSATYNGVTMSMTVSSYSGAVSNCNTLMCDFNHGSLMTTNFAQCRTAVQSELTFIEGFDDFFENAAAWRARTLNADGSAIPYGVNVTGDTWYDYSNQRINLIRKASNDPFPAVRRVQAAWCDSFGGYPSNPNTYRNGYINIASNIGTTSNADSADPPNGGYVVTDIQANQWLQWEEQPMQGSVRLTVRYASPHDNTMHFEIDGTVYPSFTLPATPDYNTYGNADSGTSYFFTPGSVHEVKIVFETAGLNFNWWQLQ